MSNSSTNTSVYKILNKSSIKELLVGNRTDGKSSFDVITGGNNPKDEALGRLCLVGQVSSEGDEDINYLVSLLGSLAKREYYSREALKEGSPRKSFERTLVKLNEVLENFFASDKLSVNVGLLAIADGELMTSKLGKFKVGLARDGEYIDVINNVDLFRKDPSSSLQFSNIISGPIKKQDKIIAFIPTKSTSTREKTLRSNFLQNDQSQFYAKIDKISQDSENFSLCGVHIDIAETRIQDIAEDIKQTSAKSEIYDNQVKDRYEDVNAYAISYKEDSEVISSTYKKVDTEAGKEDISAKPVIKDLGETSSQIIELDNSYPSMLPTAVTYSSKGATGASVRIAKLILILKNFLPNINLPGLNKINFKLVAIVIVVGISASLFFIMPTKEAKALKEFGLVKAQLIESLNSGDLKKAKETSDNALNIISPFQSKEADLARASIAELFDKAEKRDSKMPELFRDFSQQLTSGTITNIEISGDEIITVSSDKDIARSKTDSLTQVGSIKHNPASWILAGKNKILSLEDGKNLRILNINEKVEITDSNEISEEMYSPVVFGTNIYAVSRKDSQIYKIDNGTKGGFKLTKWNKDTLNGKPSSIAIDGSIYALIPSESVIKVLFKGTSQNEIKINFDITDSSQIFTLEESSDLVIFVPERKLVYIVDKTSGSLNRSYSLASIETIKDFKLGSDNSIYILDTNNKLFKL